MERIGGENFVRRNRLNIVASSIAALSVAAAAVAVEKSGSFDPITDSVDSASHLVLDTPNKAYEQLINKLPRAEKAEAAGTKSMTFNFANWSGADQTSLWLNIQPNQDIDGITYSAGTWDCNDPSDNTPPSSDCSGTTIIHSITSPAFPHGCGVSFSSPCCQNTSDLTPCTANETFRYGNCTVNAVLQLTGGQGVGWDWGARPQAPQMSGEQVTSNSTCSGSSVGGVAESPDINQLNENQNTKNKDNTISIVLGLAEATMVLAATGTAFYINRPRKSK